MQYTDIVSYSSGPHVLYSFRRDYRSKMTEHCPPLAFNKIALLSNSRASQKFCNILVYSRFFQVTKPQR